MEDKKPKVWFISDTHLGHASILYFRPIRREAAGVTMEDLQEDKWAATRKHDEWLINKWNETIGKRDTVYIIGDFCLGNGEYTKKILSRLHGKKFLIRGNHDKSCRGLENYFEGVYDIKEAKFTHEMFDFIDINEPFCIEMCHFPLVAWNRRLHGSLMVHGHTHGSIDKMNIDSEELRVDVGFDGTLAGLDFIPLEKLYQYFVDIKNKVGCKTFRDYAEWLAAKQGFRM